MLSNYYFKWFAFSCIAVLFAASIFNYIIDPYNIFQSVTLQGINTSKPATSTRTGLAKAYMVNKVAAETLIIGTSKVDVGINPENDQLPASIKPAFNLGVPGADVYQQYRYIQHAAANHRPRVILMSLEFEAFLMRESDSALYPPYTKNEVFEKRLNVNYMGEHNENQLIQFLKDVSASLISNTAVFDSVKTILAGDERWIEPTGLSSGFARFGSEVKTKGYFSVFRDTIQMQIKGIVGAKVYADSSSFQALDDVIKYCAKENIRLILFIPPYHAFQYELWDKVNLWSAFENWKLQIVQKVDEISSAESNVSLWDFSAYNDMTTEQVPQPSDINSAMQWYWEPLHFKVSLGDYMLKDIFTAGSSGTGVELSQATICQHLVKIREQRHRYREKNQKQVDLFNSIVSEKIKSLTQLENTIPDRSPCSM